jgi:hypothetical protein
MLPEPLHKSVPREQDSAADTNAGDFVSFERVVKRASADLVFADHGVSLIRSQERCFFFLVHLTPSRVDSRAADKAF